MQFPFKKKQDTFDFNVLRKCRTCGNQFQGRFCNICSEKVIEPDEYTFINFLRSLVSAFTPVEGKFLKSVGLMIRRPGQLSRNIADGSRVPYMKMLSLFFLANFFYFLFPVWDSFNSSLKTHMEMLPHQEKARRIVNERLEKEQISLAKFERTFNAQSTDLSKLLLILLPIWFTVVLYMMSFAIRLKFVGGKPKLNISFHPKFFEHMLLALELYSFYIIVNLMLLSGLILGIIWLAAQAGLNWQGLLVDQNFLWVVIVSLTYFFLTSQFTFYKQKWYWALPRVFILVFCFHGIVGLYRHLLFYVTMWTL